MNLTRLTVGFLPLLDCAPLIIAEEKGFAAAEGLQLQFVRESSWANVRDRVIVGQFQAAHMLGPMTVASSLGIGHLKLPLVAPVALGSGGNAITVSTSLWAAMQQYGARVGADPKTQGAALREVILARRRSGESLLTLATVYPFSCHNYVLRYWLSACGIDPETDVNLVVVPPPFMVDALRERQIDGCSVGDPWNTVAVEAGVGVIVTVSSAIWQHGPEKVLGMRADWAQSHAAATEGLIRAVFLAAAWCDQPESRKELSFLLAQPQYVGGAAASIERTLGGALLHASGDAPLATPEFLVFAQHFATLPWPSHALWFYAQMLRWGQLAGSDAAREAARETYRPDLYLHALRRLDITVPPLCSDLVGGFFDERVFDPNDIAGYLAAAVPGHRA